MKLKYVPTKNGANKDHSRTTKKVIYKKKITVVVFYYFQLRIYLLKMYIPYVNYMKNCSNFWNILLTILIQATRYLLIAFYTL